MNKITLFLDIDGVLSTVTQFNMTPSCNSWLRGSFFGADGAYPFDSKCVKVLNEILNQFKCDIVLSSDWRLFNTLEQMGEIFEANGVIQNPIGVTPNYPTSMTWLEKNRAGEIMKYVEDNEIDKWLAIDDLCLFNHFGDQEFAENHFAMCGSEFEGIKQSGLKDKIINKLNKL